MKPVFLLWKLILFVSQSITLAIGQIWANKVRSFLTTLGIIIGVASVTTVIASLSGLKAKIMEDIELMAGTNNIYIEATRPDKGSRISRRQLAFRPYQFDDLQEHCPSIKHYSMQSWGGTHTLKCREESVPAARVYGVEPSWHRIERRHLVLGREISDIDNDQSRYVCLIDERTRDKLNLDRDCIGDQISIGSKPFVVIGVLEVKGEMSIIGGNDNNNIEAFIPFKTNLKRQREPWIWASASCVSTEFNEEAQAELRFFLRYSRGIKPGDLDDFRVISVQSELEKFNEISRMITVVAGCVVSISLLVGGIGIMNIMLVSVSERTREIGLRKAVGAKNVAILTQFLVEAIVLCLMGGLLGIGFGKALTKALANIPNLNLDKAQIPLWAMLLSLGFAVAVGLFFGMFPAIKAARLNPIDALRHE